MDLSVFFTASTLVKTRLDYSPEKIGGIIRESAFWEEADIVLLGSNENRGSEEHIDLSGAAEAIRGKLYELSLPFEDLKVADLGNLKQKDSQEAYYEMFAYVLKTLLEAGKRVLVLGGDQSIAYGQYLAYEDMEKDIEYVHIDSRFNLADSDIQLNNRSFNHKIFLHKPNFLFNYSNLGYQRYFVTESEINTLKSLNFFALRYGNVFGKPESTEPYLRTADMLSFDFSAVRSSEAPGASYASPGGFSAMEMCQIARYAGLGYQLNSFSLTEYSPQLDIKGQTAMLGAMMCWYFMEGHATRKEDHPRKDRKNLQKYTVQLHASIESINFFKHKTSGRWWMEVPYGFEQETSFKNSRLIACSPDDYEFAKGDDIPERWWLIYNKLEK